jgi:hypothetical protein
MINYTQITNISTLFFCEKYADISAILYREIANVFKQREFFISPSYSANQLFCSHYCVNQLQCSIAPTIYHKQISRLKLDVHLN